MEGALKVKICITSWRPLTSRKAVQHAHKQKRPSRAPAPRAAIGVENQCTTVKVNELLVANDEQQLVTSQEGVSSGRDLFPSDPANSLPLGPSEFSDQPVPFYAEQDWHDRFGHYGR